MGKLFESISACCAPINALLLHIADREIIVDPSASSSYRCHHYSCHHRIIIVVIIILVIIVIVIMKLAISFSKLRLETDEIKLTLRNRFWQLCLLTNNYSTILHFFGNMIFQSIFQAIITIIKYVVWQGSINCSILPSRKENMEQVKRTWRTKENAENMENMENINLAT